MLGDGVMQDHRVHVAAADEKSELRLSQDGDRGRIVPVGLGDDADTVAMFLEHAGDDGRGKGRMVHIGIARDEDEVALVPATFFHVLLRDRKELAAGGTRRHGWHRASVMMRFEGAFCVLPGRAWRCLAPCGCSGCRLLCDAEALLSGLFSGRAMLDAPLHTVKRYPAGCRWCPAGSLHLLHSPIAVMPLLLGLAKSRTMASSVPLARTGRRRIYSNA